jgi:hypothetical protein
MERLAQGYLQAMAANPVEVIILFCSFLFFSLRSLQGALDPGLD